MLQKNKHHLYTHTLTHVIRSSTIPPEPRSSTNPPEPPYIFVIVLAGKVERGKVVVLGPRVNWCTVSQEKLHHLPMTLQSCVVQGSVPL